jgi:RHS repeat-associated protein
VTEYYHHGNQIIETRDGSGNLETQVYHGTQYIDEVVGQRIADMGRIYVHQDANYNVTGTTDLTARQIERNYYSPYGQLEVAVDSHPFDYDDDGDVDEDDYAVTTNGTCTGTATGDCRRMDADADGDVDSTDQTTISNYIASLTADTELARTPAATGSQRGNSFGYQGLFFDHELASYQNRARQYAPIANRFLQRDPLHAMIIFASGDASNLKIAHRDGLNEYASLKSNPFLNRDPSGLVCCKDRPCNGGPVGAIPSIVCSASTLGSIGGSGTDGQCVCDKGQGCCAGKQGVATCRFSWVCRSFKNVSNKTSYGWAVMENAGTCGP